MAVFVFYDTETTGFIRDFDQILQFAAILTDDGLNEVERFNIRCRCRPWTVPSPVAPKITGVRPAQLGDSSLPSFYEMMSSIRAKLEQWSPARFVGYNSQSNLLAPRVTNSNRRIGLVSSLGSKKTRAL